MKIGRNQICPLCSSGKKFKQCCGNPRLKNSKLPGIAIPKDVIFPESLFKKSEAEELIRQQQQGLGRPIIGAKWNGHQLVAVGNTIYHSPKWRTFPDFLSDYLIMVLGGDWFEQEFKKPSDDQHPIMQWYCKNHLHLKKHLGNGGTPKPVPTIGATYCYLGLAYNLYLLKHNVELQKRFIDRLKDINNFQGAYYELIISNCLIRAGFDLELEDEQDESSKHCEFSAVSKRTGKKFWVEAKSRSVVGVLGKCAHNGTSSNDPTNRLSIHLKNAFKKPANDERLIFIDVNTSCENDSIPDWFEKAENKLKMKERSLLAGQEAYVFVTNLCFHRHLDENKQSMAVLPYGLGIPDFLKKEPLRLIEIYKRKQKHIDAFNILDSFGSYINFPETFDGSLASETFSKATQSIKIGERYFFEDIGDKGLIAKVTDAIVDVQNQSVLIGTDSGHLLTKPLSDDELRDYEKHPDVFFGIVKRQGRNSNNMFEFFEDIVEIHMSYPIENTLKHMETWPNYSEIKKMSKEDIVLLYCESIAIQMDKMSKE